VYQIWRCWSIAIDSTHEKTLLHAYIHRQTYRLTDRQRDKQTVSFDTSALQSVEVADYTCLHELFLTFYAVQEISDPRRLRGGTGKVTRLAPFPGRMSPQFSCHEAEDQVTTRCIKRRMPGQTSTNTLSSGQLYVCGMHFQHR